VTVPIVPALSAYNKIAWQAVFDAAVDTTVWNTCDGWADQNGLTTHASNLSVVDGVLILAQPEKGSGAKVFSNAYLLGENQVWESLVWFPGDADGNMFNWDSAWTGQSADWPARGEHDALEVLSGKPTCNYHSPAGASNYGPIVGVWGNQWIYVTLERLSGSANVWWTPKGGIPVLVRSYDTSDNGEPETLVYCNGEGMIPIYGSDGEMKVASSIIYEIA
jgi:hypothetical protein